MAMFMVVESEQKAKCFDCEQVRKVYGVQKVLSFSTGFLDADGKVLVLELPPPGEGWSWQPTCRKCAAEHEKPDDSSDEDDKGHPLS